MRGSDVFMVPFSFLWGGFALFWNVSVWAGDSPIFFRLWGLPFLAAGLYITVGRFLLDARSRAKTSYAVTSQRVLVSSGILSPTLKSLSLRTLTDVTLTQKSDGSGTITFGPSSLAASMYAGTPWPGVALPPSFDLIPDAKRVYDIIRGAQSASASAGAPAA